MTLRNEIFEGLAAAKASTDVMKGFGVSNDPRDAYYKEAVIAAKRENQQQQERENERQKAKLGLPSQPGVVTPPTTSSTTTPGTPTQGAMPPIAGGPNQAQASQPGTFMGHNMFPPVWGSNPTAGRLFRRGGSVPKAINLAYRSGGTVVDNSDDFDEPNVADFIVQEMLARGQNDEMSGEEPGRGDKLQRYLLNQQLNRNPSSRTNTDPAYDWEISAQPMRQKAREEQWARDDAKALQTTPQRSLKLPERREPDDTGFQRPSPTPSRSLSVPPMREPDDTGFARPGPQNYEYPPNTYTGPLAPENDQPRMDPRSPARQVAEDFWNTKKDINRKVGLAEEPPPVDPVALGGRPVAMSTDPSPAQPPIAERLLGPAATKMRTPSAEELALIKGRGGETPAPSGQPPFNRPLVGGTERTSALSVPPKTPGPRPGVGILPGEVPRDATLPPTGTNGPVTPNTGPTGTSAAPAPPPGASATGVARPTQAPAQQPVDGSLPDRNRTAAFDPRTERGIGAVDAEGRDIRAMNTNAPPVAGGGSAAQQALGRPSSGMTGGQADQGLSSNNAMADLPQVLAGARSVARPGANGVPIVGQEAITRKSLNQLVAQNDGGGKYSPGSAMLRGMLAYYRVSLEQGRIDDANKMAYGIIQAANLEMSSHGSMAIDLLKRGEVRLAAQHAVAGADWAPDGMNHTLSPDGRFVITSDQNGKVTGRIPVDGRWILAAATGMQNGTLMWEALNSAAAMVNKDKGAEGRQLSNMLKVKQMLLIDERIKKLRADPKNANLDPRVLQIMALDSLGLPRNTEVQGQRTSALNSDENMDTQLMTADFGSGEPPER